MEQIKERVRENECGRDERVERRCVMRGESEKEGAFERKGKDTEGEMRQNAVSTGREKEFKKGRRE